MTMVDVMCVLLLTPNPPNTTTQIFRIFNHRTTPLDLCRLALSFSNFLKKKLCRDKNLCKDMTTEEEEEEEKVYYKVNFKIKEKICMEP
jgi:hypothetical protein